MDFVRQIRRSGPVVAGVLLGSVALLQVSRAAACSCSIPFQNELRAGDGQIPANAGVPWWFPEQLSSDPLESFVTLERVEEAGRVAVSAAIQPFEGVYVIRPSAGWSAGERYRISVDAGPLQGTPEQRFRTAEVEITPALEAALPLQVWMSTAERERLQLVDNGGSCASDHDAAVIYLDASAPEEAQAFPLGILYFTTYVDGAPWKPSSSLCESIEPGTSWTGRSSDRLVAACGGVAYDAASLDEGEHTVRMVARLPGTDVTFETPEQIVELRCSSDVLGPIDGEDEDEGADPADEAAVDAEGDGYGVAPARNPVVISEPSGGCSLSDFSARREALSLGAPLVLAALALAYSRRRSVSAS